MLQNKEKKSTLYHVMEHFYTIQGEGYNSGKAAYFIRLSGCDVECVWCDVKESWDINNSKSINVDELTDIVIKSKANLVILTGGEPTMQDLSSLVKNLKKYKIQVAIETSGSRKIINNIDWVCLSPKKFKLPLEESYKKADELKIIIYNKSDFSWAEEQAKKVNFNCLLYLQAEWSKLERNLPLVIEYVKKNPKWRISLQTHKFMNIP